MIFDLAHIWIVLFVLVLHVIHFDVKHTVSQRHTNVGLFFVFNFYNSLKQFDFQNNLLKNFFLWKYFCSFIIIFPSLLPSAHFHTFSSSFQAWQGLRLLLLILFPTFCVYTHSWSKINFSLTKMWNWLVYMFLLLFLIF